jgi:enoyl-[acyl-carrier protein] reductase I
MGILDGKKILITGVLTDDSIAFHTARQAQLEGAEVVLTSFGRALSLTSRVARRLPTPADVLELDVGEPSHFDRVVADLTDRFGRLDGLVHSIAFAPDNCLGKGVFAADWADVARTLEVSTYSLKSLAQAMLPLFEAADGGSIIGYDFDATVAWPGYDWMGVAKAALESLARYLARDLGAANIRVNLVSAGPLRTMAAKSIPGFSRFEDVWDDRSPLGWDVTADHQAVARTGVALLSDFFLKTTGEIIHVDGGFHAVGA